MFKLNWFEKSLTFLCLASFSQLAFATVKNTEINNAELGKPSKNIHKTSDNIVIDGVAQELSWASVKWHNLDHHMIGSVPSKDDFSGRFKLLWDQDYIYLLAEITDDVLFDQHADPLFKYWDDDCLEIFIDENASGGGHQFNFNAFAYHIGLDNQVADIGPNYANGDTQFVLLNDHVKSRWRRAADAPNQVVWEVAMKIYDDSFSLKSTNNKPLTLAKGKELGFMLAYCDNDGSAEREHFYGSEKITPINNDKNLGFKTADVFGKYKLVE